MFKKKDFKNRQPYFLAVAMATIICGVLVLALGAVELGLNLLGQASFAAPVFKIIGGLAVISLGYIHLELELLRIK